MFNGRIFIDGNTVLNFLVEEGICIEDAKCNLRWVSFAPDFQCCYFQCCYLCESSCLFYLRFNFVFSVSKIMH